MRQIKKERQCSKTVGDRKEAVGGLIPNLATPLFGLWVETSLRIWMERDFVMQ